VNQFLIAFCEKSRPEMTEPNTPPVPHVLAKPTGAVCNLDCRYCFFLSKELLYPDSRFRMSDELLETYVRQTIESEQGPEVNIAWQGGEPTLMGLDFFRRSIEYEKLYLKPGQGLQNTLQTNGVELDQEWCEFFRENNFLIGLSLDGTREMHDAYRVDKGGHGTFDRVMRAVRLMQKERVEFNILCTVHAANACRPLDLYRFLRDEVGTRFIQFIPIVERVTPELMGLANEGWGQRRKDRPLYTQTGNLVTERTVRPEQWGQFLIAIFDEWVRRDVGMVFVQMFDAALASWVGAPASMCIFAETCGDAVALEHNGDLYSCDHYVEPQYLLGNVNEQHLVQLVGSDKQQRFGQDKVDTLPRYCLECEFRFACNGECPRNRFIQTPSGEAGLNYLCAGYKAFFKHVDRPMWMMAELLRRGRYADEVMQMLAAEEAAQLQDSFARAGRNDPCPCGSGQKYKRCHGPAFVNPKPDRDITAGTHPRTD
jgi:uncharacterized protein